MTLSPAFEFSSQHLDFGVTRPVNGLYATAIIWEFFLTFFLMLVIISVATDYRAVGKAAGLAIGGTVLFEAMFAGPLCGASMNPARSLGPAVVSNQWEHFSAYLIGPVSGAVSGAFVYRWIACDPEETKSEVKGCC